MTDMELQFHDVAKRYGAKEALRGIDLTLTPGVYGLLGPNGAGKSTLMNILTGNLRPTRGHVTLDGQDTVSMGEAFRRRLGYCPQQQALYPGFTGEQFLYYMASLQGMSREDAKRRMDWAKDTMTPVKMKQFESQDAYMDLTPEQFKSQLDIIEAMRLAPQETLSGQDAAYVKEEEAVEEMAREQTRQEVAEALKSEEAVYQMLDKYDLPQTPAFLSGISEMLKDRNSVYRNLQRFASGDSQDISAKQISDLIEDLIEEYGEACKTPKEMADAQHKLEETAEKVMKNMLVEKDVTSIDVRGMKLVMTQIQALGQMGEQSETYNIPILVEDKLGNLSLKIVRGSEEKGLVDVALDMDESGAVSASFRYENGQISGDVAFEKEDIARLFSDHMPYLANAMREETGLPVSFAYAADAGTNVDDFYEKEDADFAVTKEQDVVSTKVLYGIARSFVAEVAELLS